MPTPAESPSISVLMPVYNASKFLKEAIDSILQQTFTNFELILVDDGSVDDSSAIIHGYEDNRIRYIKHEQNMGIVAALNRGLAIANGKYIARMDSDDIALPHRLQTQYDFLEKNSDVSICGSNAITIDEQGQFHRIWFYASDPTEVKLSSLFVCPFLHPTVMVRKEVYDALHGYQSGMEPAEDFELWIRLLNKYKGANIQDILLYYRIGNGSYSERKKAEALKKVGEVYELHADILGTDCTYMNLHVRSEYGEWAAISLSELNSIRAWGTALRRINKQSNNYETHFFNQQLKKYIVNNYLKIASQNGGKIKVLALIFALLESPTMFVCILKRKKRSEQV